MEGMMRKEYCSGVVKLKKYTVDRIDRTIVKILSVAKIEFLKFRLK